MSGVEVIGLALGVLSLAIGASEHVETVLRPISFFMKFSSRLIDLQTRLALQRSLFRFQCRDLIEGVARVSPKDSAIMLEDSGSLLWRKKDVEDRFRAGLGREGAVWSHTVRMIQERFRKIGEKLQIASVESEIPITAVPPNTQEPDSRTLKRTYKKLKISFSNNQISEDINELKGLVKQFSSLSKRIIKANASDSNRPMSTDVDHTRGGSACNQNVTSFRLARYTDTQRASQMLYDALISACERHSEHIARLGLDFEFMRAQNQLYDEVEFTLIFAPTDTSSSTGVRSTGELLQFVLPVKGRHHQHTDDHTTSLLTPQNRRGLDKSLDASSERSSAFFKTGCEGSSKPSAPTSLSNQETALGGMNVALQAGVSISKRVEEYITNDKSQSSLTESKAWENSRKAKRRKVEKRDDGKSVGLTVLQVGGSEKDTNRMNLPRLSPSDLTVTSSTAITGDFCIQVARCSAPWRFDLGLAGIWCRKNLGSIPTMTRPQTAISLQNVFEHTKNLPPWMAMSLLARIKLAISLSEAILQYNQTQWLSETWSSSNIVFLSDSESPTDSLDSETISKICQTSQSPFIESTIKRPSPGVGKQPAPMDPELYFSPIRNPLLVRLGVMLMELAYQAPLSMLAAPAGYHTELEYRRTGSPSTQSILRDYHTAKLHCEDVSRVMGVKYMEVVQKCLDCDFGAGTNLSQKHLQEKYLEDVVVKLQGIEEGLRRILL